MNCFTFQDSFPPTTSLKSTFSRRPGSTSRPTHPLQSEGPRDSSASSSGANLHKLRTWTHKSTAMARQMTDNLFLCEQRPQGVGNPKVSSFSLFVVEASDSQDVLQASRDILLHSPVQRPVKGTLDSLSPDRAGPSTVLLRRPRRLEAHSVRDSRLNVVALVADLEISHGRLHCDPDSASARFIGRRTRQSPSAFARDESDPRGVHGK